VCGTGCSEFINTGTLIISTTPPENHRALTFPFKQHSKALLSNVSAWSYKHCEKLRIRVEEQYRFKLHELNTVKRKVLAASVITPGQSYLRIFIDKVKGSAVERLAFLHVRYDNTINKCPLNTEWSAVQVITHPRLDGDLYPHTILYTLESVTNTFICILRLIYVEQLLLF
jgi:hypothetical protein